MDSLILRNRKKLLFCWWEIILCFILTVILKNSKPFLCTPRFFNILLRIFLKKFIYEKNEISKSSARYLNNFHILNAKVLARKFAMKSKMKSKNMFNVLKLKSDWKKNIFFLYFYFMQVFVILRSTSSTHFLTLTPNSSLTLFFLHH